MVKHKNSQPQGTQRIHKAHYFSHLIFAVSKQVMSVRPDSYRVSAFGGCIE